LMEHNTLPSHIPLFQNTFQYTTQHTISLVSKKKWSVGQRKEV